MAAANNSMPPELETGKKLSFVSKMFKMVRSCFSPRNVGLDSSVRRPTPSTDNKRPEPVWKRIMSIFSMRRKIGLIHPVDAELENFESGALELSLLIPPTHSRTTSAGLFLLIQLLLVKPLAIRECSLQLERAHSLPPPRNHYRHCYFLKKMKWNYLKFTLLLGI